MADNCSFKKKERKLLLQPKQRSDKSEDSFELLPFENLCHAISIIVWAEAFHPSFSHLFYSGVMVTFYQHLNP